MDFLKNFDFQSFLEIIKDDPRLLIFAAIGILLIFILLIWIFSSDSKPKKRSFTPADPPKVIDFVQKLGQVTEQGREILDYLDEQIRQKSTVLEQINQNVENLRQEKIQIEEALQRYKDEPHEYIIETEKAHKYEIQILTKNLKTQSTYNWFVGFSVGFLISGIGFVLLYFFIPIKNFVLNLMNP